MKNEILFLLIDDEDSVLFTVEKLIYRVLPDAKIMRANDGETALEIIRESHPSIVISDISMSDLNGLDLLSKVREDKNYNDIYFIVLTGISDSEIITTAFEKGADDFITKPIKHNEIQARLRPALRIVNMQHQLKYENKQLTEVSDELQQGINDITKLASKFLQARLPYSTDMLKRVAQSSVWIAHQIGGLQDYEIEDLEIAAYLSYAGKVFLPDNLLKMPVMTDGRPSHKLMFNIPLNARDILSSIPRYKNVANILYHVYENYDGSGFPERFQNWQIPLPSRIIRAALDFEELIEVGSKKHDTALEILKNQAKRIYDNRVLILLEQFISEMNPNSDEVAIALAELNEGMILAQDIITNSGLKIMPEGAVLHDNIIHKLYSINSTDPIIGNVYVKKV